MGETMPTHGRKAPDFTLRSCSGREVTLTDLQGHWVVLYFYPKDDTPGCTVEAQGFTEAAEDFRREGAIVLGVSPDDIDSHCKFTEKYGLDLELLEDTHHQVAERYSVWVEKNNFGKTYMGVQRATFLISPQGKIAHVWPKVKPEDHAQEVLRVLHERKVE